MSLRSCHGKSLPNTLISGKCTWFLAVSLMVLISGSQMSYAQPVVKVQGSKHAPQIKQQVLTYLDHLDVHENLHLTIRVSPLMPDKLEGITLPVSSPEPELYQFFRVLIDARLRGAKQRLVLAHEMIHVKQFVKKELVILSEDRVVWKGKVHNYAHTIGSRMPWEKEAYRTDRSLSAQIDSPPKEHEMLLASRSTEEEMDECTITLCRKYRDERAELRYGQSRE